MTEIAITLITEAYNLAEGQGWDELVAATGIAARLAQRPGVEAILTDPSGDARVEALARSTQLRYLAVPGASYDQQKTAAARIARGAVLAFLDGDCRPVHDDWLDRLTEPIRDGRAMAAGGTTFYDDATPRGIACTIMDFGFLWDDPGGDMGCYASNNVAFLRDAWLEQPPPDSPMRCTCFMHAQLLLRRGTPIRHVPAAQVRHELPDIHKERWRRGYDVVASCWVDPTLAETAWLAPGDDNIMRFIDQNIRLDAQRFHSAPPELGLGEHNAREVEREILALREIDIAGIRAALAEGEATGRNAVAREAHARAAITPIAADSFINTRSPPDYP